MLRLGGDTMGDESDDEASDEYADLFPSPPTSSQCDQLQRAADAASSSEPSSSASASASASFAGAAIASSASSAASASAHLYVYTAHKAGMTDKKGEQAKKNKIIHDMSKNSAHFKQYGYSDPGLVILSPSSSPCPPPSGRRRHTQHLNSVSLLIYGVRLEPINSHTLITITTTATVTTPQRPAQRRQDHTDHREHQSASRACLPGGPRGEPPGERRLTAEDGAGARPHKDVGSRGHGHVLCGRRNPRRAPPCRQASGGGRDGDD